VVEMLNAQLELNGVRMVGGMGRSRQDEVVHPRNQPVVVRASHAQVAFTAGKTIC
jgi:hypothetical protein